MLVRVFYSMNAPLPLSFLCFEVGVHSAWLIAMCKTVPLHVLLRDVCSSLVHHCKYTTYNPRVNVSVPSMYAVYQKAQSGYSGRVTVPVLWDKKTETIVNNESSEIIKMLHD